MLLKAKYCNGIKIYRKGIGYFLKILGMIQDYDFNDSLKNYLMGIGTIPQAPAEIIKTALRIFTGLRFPKIYYYFNQEKSLKLLFEIIKFNAPPQAFSESSTDKKYSIDDIAVAVIDTMTEGGYYNGVENILHTIDYYTYIQIRDRIQERKAAEIKIKALIQHDPRSAMEIADKMQGIEKIENWSALNARKNR